MNLDDLKVTILRATRPGDVVFFQVMREPDTELKSLIVAIADYLRPLGITPVMLPPMIEVSGTLFERSAEPPPQWRNPIVDAMNSDLVADIKASSERVQQYIYMLEANADPAGDKWRLLASIAQIRELQQYIKDHQPPPPTEPPLWKPFDGTVPEVEVQPPAPQPAPPVDDDEILF